MEKLYSSAVAGALARRTVHIKMHPTARTFNERREVLRVLERFGEVTMFRSYKYNLKNPVSNAFLSVFKDEAAALAIVQASPMRYRLVSDAMPSMMPKAGTAVAEREATTRVSAEATGEQEKIFELNVSPSQFDHEHHVANEPLFGPWLPVDRKNSFFGAGLEVPRNLMSSGLQDWETEGRKWRNAGDDVEGVGAALEGLGVRSLGTDGAGKDGVNRQWRVGQRRKRRVEKQLKDGIMAGLKDYSGQNAKKGGASVGNLGERLEDQESERQKRTTKETRFGAWPGKNSSDLLREKQQRAVVAGLKETDVGELPMR